MTVISSGSMNLELGTMSFEQTKDLLGLRSSVVHEVLHFLGYENVIRTYAEYNSISGQLADTIVYLVSKGLALNEAENIMISFLRRYVQSPKKARVLYERGKLFGKEKNLESLILKIEDSGEIETSIDLIVKEIIKIYKINGISTRNIECYFDHSLAKKDRMIISYEAHVLAGIFLAGYYVEEWEKTGKKPLSQIKEFHDDLLLGRKETHISETDDSITDPEIKKLVGDILAILGEKGGVEVVEEIEKLKDVEEIIKAAVKKPESSKILTKLLLAEDGNTTLSVFVEISNAIEKVEEKDGRYPVHITKNLVICLMKEITEKCPNLTKICQELNPDLAYKRLKTPPESREQTTDDRRQRAKDGKQRTEKAESRSDEIIPPLEKINPDQLLRQHQLSNQIDSSA